MFGGTQQEAAVSGMVSMRRDKKTGIYNLTNEGSRFGGAEGWTVEMQDRVAVDYPMWAGIKVEEGLPEFDEDDESDAKELSTFKRQEQRLVDALKGFGGSSRITRLAEAAGMRPQRAWPVIKDSDRFSYAKDKEDGRVWWVEFNQAYSEQKTSEQKTSEQKTSEQVNKQVNKKELFTFSPCGSKGSRESEQFTSRGGEDCSLDYPQASEQKMHSTDNHPYLIKKYMLHESATTEGGAIDISELANHLGSGGMMSIEQAIGRNMLFKTEAGQIYCDVNADFGGV